MNTSKFRGPWAVFLSLSFATGLTLLPLYAAAETDSPPPMLAADDEQQHLGNWSQGYWRLNAVPFSVHYIYSLAHRPVWGVGLERERRDAWFGGAAYFNNSFDQPSAYVFLGKRFTNMFGVNQIFGEINGGIMYGYVGEYSDRVYFNYKGFSPAALVGIGWQFNKTSSATLHALGIAGFILQLSHTFR